jgi:hypothetical protein
MRKVFSCFTARPWALTFFVATLILCLASLPDPAHADVIDDITKGFSKLFFAVIVIVMMVIGVMQLLRHHIMGLFVLIGAAVIVLLAGNTDLVVKLAQAFSNLFHLNWGAPGSGGTG